MSVNDSYMENKIQKCDGIVVSNSQGTVHETFPFTIPPKQNFVFENGFFHDATSVNKNDVL